jgi:hypothetical protein
VSAASETSDGLPLPAIAYIRTTNDKNVGKYDDIVRDLLAVWVSRIYSMISVDIRGGQFLLRNIQPPCFDVVKRRLSRVIGVNEGQLSPLPPAGIGVEYSL